MDKQYKWDLTKFCSSIDDCKAKMNNVLVDSKNLDKYLGHLNEKDILIKYLKESMEITNRFYICYVYSFAGLDAEFDNEKLKELNNWIQMKSAEFSKLEAPFTAELKTLDEEYLMGLKSEPAYSEWKFYLDGLIRVNKHLLGEVEEKILAEFSALSQGFKSINNNCYFSDIKYEDVEDEKGEKHHLNTGNMGKFIQSSDRTLRKNTAISAKKAYSFYGDLMTQNFISLLKTRVAENKIRKYDSVLSRVLEGYFIDEKVYQNVINYAKEYFDIVIRYYECKRKLLGLDKLYSFDKMAPLNFKQNTYTFEEGFNIVKNAMSVLGQDYVELLDRAYNERWMDVYPRDTKRSGGYTWGTYGITNIVLLNWTDDLDSVFTLAHELGHAIHEYTLYQHQEVQNSDVPLFIAEVASTFNENILFDYIYKNATSVDEKFALLDYYTHNIIRTVFNQCTYSEFEDFCYKTIENEEPISKEIISKKWCELVSNPLDGVIDGSYSNPLSWQNFTHFYDSSYYVWQYALAYTISSEFSARVLNGGEKDRKDYFEFLAGGHQEKPTELLKRLGIDINSKDFCESSFKNFEKAVDRFEKETDIYLSKRTVK